MMEWFNREKYNTTKYYTAVKILGGTCNYMYACRWKYTHNTQQDDNNRRKKKQSNYKSEMICIRVLDFLISTFPDGPVLHRN